MEISIYDDWSRLTPYVEEQDRRVCLTFTVSGTDVVAMMNVGTIPKLVSYGDKFMANLDAQREGASRESQTFRAANPPKPDNPLSAVANAMLSSARSRLKEADTALSYVVGQSLRLKLRFLQLVVFPRSMNDGELAQLMGSDIQAQLDRLVESEALPAQRDLHLSFSSLTISKLSQLHQIMASKDKSLSSRDWLLVLTRGVPEATIFGLPSMNMWMRSDEEITESTRNITYDFSSTFNAKGSMQDPEDIFITLNMSLYSWLTILRKTFAREMSQVHAGAEGRVTGGQLTAQHRRKTTEVVCQSTKQSISSGLQALPKASNLKPPVIRDIELPLSATPQLSPTNPTFASLQVPSLFDDDKPQVITTTASSSKTANSIIYRPRSRHIERLTMRQLGEATPDITHPFFTKKAGFNLEDSLPQYVHEYATIPTEEIMKALLKLYSRQLKADVPRHMTP